MTVNDATVIRSGVEAKNGVIQIIDRVLILAAQATPNERNLT